MTANSTTFKKGTSGNPSGRSKTKLLTDQIRAELVQHPEKARAIATKLIDMAIGGDLQAATIVMDRIEGRPTQQIDVTQTTYNATPEEIDQRIVELTNRLKIASVVPLLELSASEVPGEDDKRH
jgi:hypothetical protein